MSVTAAIQHLAGKKIKKIKCLHIYIYVDIIFQSICTDRNWAVGIALW